MRRCLRLPKKAICRSDPTTLAASLRLAEQPLRPFATRAYRSSQRLHPAASLATTRHPRRTISANFPSQISRRCFNFIADVATEKADVPSKVASFAFAFDIDGVLLRSSKPLPGASEALLYLQKNNIPFILLTNGGGKLESERVAELSEKLGVPLSETNFIQSHTPFKRLVKGVEKCIELGDYISIPALENKTILVTGSNGDKCRRIAESYGFKNVVTPGDILNAHPDIWPFSKSFSDAGACRPLPRPIDPKNPAKSLKIDAILVFNDPRDWAVDIQIIMDLLLSKDGVLGTVSKKNGDKSLRNNGYQNDGQPLLFFSNPDILWASAYHMPRLGQGAFHHALHGVFGSVKSEGRGKLRSITYGKPNAVTYRYAEDVLTQHREELIGLGGEKTEHMSPLSQVFMVGDNPASDIRGANLFKSLVRWTSILVKTGVYQDGTEPMYKPKIIVDNVLEAVKWALKKKGRDYDADTLEVDQLEFDQPDPKILEAETLKADNEAEVEAEQPEFDQVEVETQEVDQPDVKKTDA